MTKQTDEWVAQFYGCLLGWESLWRSRNESWNRSSLRSKPIIRLDNDSHVAPFDSDGNPNAYLPVKGASQASIVKRSIARDKTANEFLKRLGITEPDVVAKVIEEILPLYESVEASPSVSEHSEHMKTILSAWSTDSIAKRDRLLKKLKETPFIRFNCRANGFYGYAEPSDVYFPNEDLLQYFDGVEDAKFVVTSYSKDAKDLLEELGVANTPRCFEVSHGEPRRPHRTTRPARIINFQLDGLDEYLERIGQETDVDVRFEMSLRLWHYLLVLAQSDDDYFHARRIYFYYSYSSEFYASLLTLKLRDAAWIPASNGDLARPQDVSVDQLPENFTPHHKIISALSIKPDPNQAEQEEREEKRDLASQLGIALEDAEFIRENLEAFQSFRQSVLDRVTRKELVEQPETGNRDRRRRKLKERRQSAPTKKSIMKLRSVPSYSRSEIDRQALFNFYFDEVDQSVFCQICLDTMPFVKRNGEECSECVDLFTENWASSRNIELKVMTPLNLVLCPVCSEIYRDYVHKDFERQRRCSNTCPATKSTILRSANPICAAIAKVASFT